jgi:cytochrome b561
MVPVGLIMTQELPRATQNTLFIIHKGLGPIVLVVVVIRLVWRFFNPPPPLPASVPDIQRRISAVVHVGLYVFLIVMAISGYVRVIAGGFPIELLNAIGVPPLLAKNEPLAETAKAIHAAAKFGLVGLIAVHVAAAVFHAIVKRDGVFSRMWPPYRA